jgi:hypothetical protein
MGRIFPLVAAIICLAPASGCGGLGLYRAAGHIPGVAASDYAFYNFCGTSSQLYQFSPPEVEGSTIEAMGDLGFKIVEPPTHLPTGETFIVARAPEGSRPVTIKIFPQNSLTNVQVDIGPAHLGDEELSRDLFRRIALNFGTGIRAYTPVDRTLPKRVNLSYGFVPQAERTPPMQLQGDGLRPNENRDQALTDVSAIPGQESPPGSNVPGNLQGLLQGLGGQRGPYFPGVPYPVPPNPYIPFTTPSNDQ